MGSVSVCADKIISICDELKALLSNGGVFNEYSLGLLAKLQKLSLMIDLMEPKSDHCAIESYRARREGRLKSGEKREDDMKEAFSKALGDWRTTDEGNHIHFNENGEPDKGNPYVIAAIKGELEKKESKEARARKLSRKAGMKAERKVVFSRPGSVSRDSLGRGITHFNHDEDEMTTTRAIVMKGEDGRVFKMYPGKIKHLTVFAGGDTNRAVDKAQWLSRQSGGSEGSWKHVKGIATVIDASGKEHEADVHWFESPEVGQTLWKVKNLLEEMDESQIYWEEK